MKKSIYLLLFLSILLLPWNSFAESKKRIEICVSGGFFISEGNSCAIAGASLGYNFRFIASEVFVGVIDRGTVLGVNLLLGLFDNQLVIPYVSGGIWTIEGNNTIVAGGSGFNVGGGIKIKFSEVFAIRTEFRRYFVESHWGVNIIIGGVSLYF